jgi:hypothetical protein
MDASRSKRAFWALLAAQVAGAQVILWRGVPVYRRLIRSEAADASADDLALAVAAVIVMQAGYWLARRLQPGLRFRGNVLVSHLLLWFGELSFFFPHALAALVLFERPVGEHFVLWKLPILAGILFSITCYKNQLLWLSDALCVQRPAAADTPPTPGGLT